MPVPPPVTTASLPRKVFIGWHLAGSTRRGPPGPRPSPPRRADEAGEEVAPAHVTGGEADADEGGIHARRLARDPHVGGERQGEAAAARRPVHRRDDRLRRAPHEHHELAHLALAAEA